MTRFPLALSALVLSGIPVTAADTVSVVVPKDHVPFELSRNSVIRGTPLKIGDLTPVTQMEADEMVRNSRSSHEQWDQCVQTGPQWVRWSADGSELELTYPWNSFPQTHVLTAYCDEGIVFLGGFCVLPPDQVPPDDGGDRRIVFFKASPDGPFGPTTVSNDQTFDVGKSERYRLNEIRAIDPISRRLLIAGTSVKGESVLLAAPFAFVTPPAHPAEPVRASR